MSHSPPAFALWLLRVFAGRYATDAFIGDAIESFQMHRKARRFWWEVAHAIGRNALELVRENAATFALAVACAWLALFVCRYSAFAYVKPTINSLAQEVLWQVGFDATGERLSWLTWLTLSTLWIGSVSIMLGLIIRSLHRRFRRTAAWVVFVAFMAWPHAGEYAMRIENSLRYPTGGWLEPLYLQTYFLIVSLLALLLTCRVGHGKAARPIDGSLTVH